MIEDDRGYIFLSLISLPFPVKCCADHGGGALAQMVGSGFSTVTPTRGIGTVGRAGGSGGKNGQSKVKI